ncbi:U3 small nucleolar RNA-associated protein 21-like protein [Golovinomyces cichoracearum]|uniref:U3 small nucleolar RNA-associated protein 21-like protein n=1 Tax=Golovinomyces cichoracearum TaxID=62708 RepID=A0A420IDY1_9PEZI|nr:U3 small nucleolar RNA-associated protein 21-like protein [Golovinomyces cichoracearum]
MSDTPLQGQYEVPNAKRQKLNAVKTPRSSFNKPRIFTPFRTIGLVSPTNVPFTSIPLGKETFQITTSVGKCLQTYDLKQGLQLLFLTRPQTPEVITATLAWKNLLFAAWGGVNSMQGFWVFKRGKMVAELDIPSTDKHEPIRQILIFGSWIVASCSTKIEVWKSDTYEHYTTLYSIASTKGGNELTGGISNMPTYLNKIFAGRKDGGVEVWNVYSGKLIYTILPPAANCGSVTAMQFTPALSLLSIAYSEGLLIIHNVRTDKTVKYIDSGSSTIFSISFRTDDLGAGEDGRKPGVMATAGPKSGDVTLWDLNERGRVMGILRGAHNPPSDAGAIVSGGVSKIQFLPGQPVLITSGFDNSLKSWIFDESPFSPIPRILHFRSGHAAPATRLLFLPSDSDGADMEGKWLISTGQDRSLWGWSLRRDGQSAELSQGNIRKKSQKMGIPGSTLNKESNISLNDLKAPEIICIAISLNRDGGMGANPGNGCIWQKNQNRKKLTDATLSGNTGWESIVTGHKDDRFARTWFWGRKKAGRWMLETSDGGNVTSVTVSPCGSFAVIGSETGGIDMYNLQSGLHRQRYPAKLKPSQTKKHRMEQAKSADQNVTKFSRSEFAMGYGKHKKAVTGLVVDSLNKNIISCSLDGKVKFWDFRTSRLLDELDWYPITAITAIRYFAPNDLIALACEDLSIRIIDIETKKVIREFAGCRGTVNDFCFSNDGRWVIAASSDCIIRVWDLPTGHLIDGIRTKNQTTALSFSSTGEFLATTSEGELGINIWNNRTLFTHVPTRNISESDIAEAIYPTVSGEGSHRLLEAAFEESDSESENAAPAPALEQLSKDIQTLSLLPRSRWQNLLYLDVIKARNKPVEAPQIPKNAPFFLPSLKKPLTLQEANKDDGNQSILDKSRIMRLSHLTAEGKFTSSLRAGLRTGDYTIFIDHLKTLSPSAADLELRSLDPCEEFVPFVTALTHRLRERLDYELVQAWMSVFLRLHSDSINCHPEVVKALQEWRIEHTREAQRIGELVSYCGGVVSFLRSGL